MTPVIPEGPGLVVRSAKHRMNAYDDGGYSGECKGRYIGPLKHLRGMTALIKDEHPYRLVEGIDPQEVACAPTQLAAQFDRVAWRSPEVHARRRIDRKDHAGTMVGPDECALCCQWHVFDRTDFEEVL